MSTPACKHCGERINWRNDGVAFGDGSAAHVRCYEAHETKRQKRSQSHEDERKGGMARSTSPGRYMAAHVAKKRPSVDFKRQGWVQSLQMSAAGTVPGTSFSTFPELAL